MRGGSKGLPLAMNRRIITNKNKSTIHNNNNNSNNGKKFALIIIFIAVTFTMTNYWYIHITLSKTIEKEANAKFEAWKKQQQIQKQKQQQQIQQKNQQKSSPTAEIVDAYNEPDPVWWIESPTDRKNNNNTNTNFLERTYGDITNLTHLRTNLSTIMKPYYAPLCGYYEFNIDSMPYSTSIIITTQSEPYPRLSMTVHSILARTHPQLLYEIIIVDDNGFDNNDNDEGWRDHVNETELQILSQLPKVILIQNSIREGCARSRLVGANSAKGDILVFVDSHIEMTSSTWLQHLMIPILENKRTMAVQTIDVIDDITNQYGTRPGYLQMGIIDRQFFFDYRRMKYWTESKEYPPIRLPYETPFVPGSLFAIRRDEFLDRLGGYDRGLYVWGGENIELALKVWMCGGRVVMVPCSRVGHIYRVHMDKHEWPPKLPQQLTDRLGCAYPGGKFRIWGSNNGYADNFTKIVTRNNMRIILTWIGKDHPAKHMYYKLAFGVDANSNNNDLAPEWKQYEDELYHDKAFQEQLYIKEQLQCRDFDWFDRHVYMKLLGIHHPWHENEWNKTVDCGGYYEDSCMACVIREEGKKEFCRGDCAWCNNDDNGNGNDGSDGDHGEKKDRGFCYHKKKEKKACPSK